MVCNIIRFSASKFATIIRGDWVYDACLREFESQINDAANFVIMIFHRIYRADMSIFRASLFGLSKIQPAGQLAHNNKIYALNFFRAQG